MKLGTLIKHFLYNDRGRRIYRLGIVLKVLPRKKIEVFWFARHPKPHIEIIKMELIEVLSEGE